MKNSVSDQSLFVESEDEDVVDEQGSDALERGYVDSDGYSDSVDASSMGSSREQNKPSSYNTTWPQSYRQSMDMYGSLQSPSIGFLGTPTLSRFSSSFLSSSLQKAHSPEILPNLIKPLLPTAADQQQEPQHRSHSLLPPVVERKPSLKKADHKVSHEVPISRQSTYCQAVINGINVLCGVGILSTPYAVREGGWLGLTVLFAFAVITWYTGVLLGYCLQSSSGLETYPDIGQAAFGNIGRFAISVVLYVELYACCVEYIILESDNLSSLFPNAHLNIGGLHLNSHYLFALLSTLAVLPTVYLRDMTILSYISAGGVIASILVVFCLFWVGLIDNVGFEHRGSLINMTGLPVAIGLYGYCYSGHAVYPNIYSSMKKPSQYQSVLFTSFTICTLMYAGAALMGYMMFGEATQSQFTLNMPKNLVASKIAVWTTIVNPFTKYALTITPIALSLEELMPSSHLKSHINSYIIRTALVISTLVVALSIPFFGFVMALVGSLLTMLVALILPCICYLSILRGKLTWIQGSPCVFIIIVGIVSSVIGTYSALLKIIEKLGS